MRTIDRETRAAERSKLGAERLAFVTADRLQAELSGGRPPLLLDVRFTLEDGPRYDEYLAGHLPGARFVDLERELSGPRIPGLGHYPLPSAEAFTESARSWGLSADSEIVAYAGYTGISAGRMAWLLHWFGHRRVRILNGGLHAWIQGGFPLVTESVPPAVRGDFTPSVGVQVASTAKAQELGHQSQLLDVRARSQFTLKQPDPQRANRRPGRIPGAVNVPATSFHRRNGLLRSGDEILDILERHKIDTAQSVGVYCGGGVASAWAAQVLRVVGVDALLFAASWSEYAGDSRLPVEVER